MTRSDAGKDVSTLMGRSFEKASREACGARRHWTRSANRDTRSMWQESSKQHAERNQAGQSRRRNPEHSSRESRTSKGKSNLAAAFPFNLQKPDNVGARGGGVMMVVSGACGRAGKLGVREASMERRPDRTDGSTSHVDRSISKACDMVERC